MLSEPAGLLSSADMLAQFRLAQLAAGLSRKPGTEGHIRAWARPHCLPLLVPTAGCATSGESLHPLSLSFPGQVGMTVLIEVPTVKPCALGSFLLFYVGFGAFVFCLLEKLSLKKYFLKAAVLNCFLPDSGICFPASSAHGLLA